jgi:hypothetical protein
MRFYFLSVRPVTSRRAFGIARFSSRATGTSSRAWSALDIVTSPGA